MMTGTDTDAIPVYHFRKNEPVTLTCSGLIDGQPFSVPAALTVDQPTSTFNVPIGITTAYPYPNNLMQISPASGTISDSPWGVVFDATVTIQAPYTGVGSFYFTQLATPNRLRTQSNPDPQNPSGPPIVTTQHYVFAGPLLSPLVLDNDVVYGTKIANNHPPVNFHTTFSTGTSSNPVAAVNNDLSTEQPGIGDGIHEAVDSGWQTKQVGAAGGSEKFTTYLMFTPPGPGNSLPVPLKIVNWNWYGTLTYSYNFFTSRFEYTGSGLGQSSDGSGTLCTSHPTWQANVLDFTYQ
jgi:hypothetical protein